MYTLLLTYSSQLENYIPHNESAVVCCRVNQRKLANLANNSAISY